ncbi:MAG: hypothetical protein CMO66_01580 [Verrucomicrobiales bacterium]|nr:hypothetical protein [Verrucomicrobiales bacterium]
MASSPNSSRKAVYLLLLLPLLGAVAWSQGVVNRGRGQLNVAYLEPIQNAPPLMRFATETLGGFRGVLSTVLWMRINQMQLDGKYYEMMQLSEWITRLQPHTPRVWTDRAWNLAYNISVKEKDTDERWKWVYAGIKLLRDEAIQYNPHEPELYWELAWTFQHKMGQDMDVAQRKYKTIWINWMSELLWPSIEECMDENGRPVPVDFDSLINPPQDDSEKSQNTRERARRLVREFKMDPRRMRQFDREFGTAPVLDPDGEMREKYIGMEWRLPETHAMYWAWIGVQKCQHNLPRLDMVRKLRREMFQSMKISCDRGLLLVDRNVPDWKQRYRDGQNWDLAPRLEAAEIVEQMYIRQIEWTKAKMAEQEQKSAEAKRRVEELGSDLGQYVKLPNMVSDATLQTFENAHHNFYRGLVSRLYLNNQMQKAMHYFRLMADRYPEKVKFYKGFDINTKTLDLEAYVVSRLQEEMESGGRSNTMQILVGLIRRAYFMLAQGREDDAIGLIRQAEFQHKAYQTRRLDTEEDRVKLRPFESIHADALRGLMEFLDKEAARVPGANKQLQDHVAEMKLKAAILRGRLGLQPGQLPGGGGAVNMINPSGENGGESGVTPGAGN